jgi:hypothetical protein
MWRYCAVAHIVGSSRSRAGDRGQSTHLLILFTLRLPIVFCIVSLKSEGNAGLDPAYQLRLML